MKKTEYAAVIYDGHSHIERRVYEDEDGYRCVRINGWFFRIIDLKHQVTTYYTGKEPVRM